MAQQAESMEVLSLKKRYTDAYLVDRATVTAGKFFKGLGVLIASLVILGGIIAGIKLGYEASNAPYPAKSDPTMSAFLGFACFLGGLIVAAFTGGIVYILGILISAEGQTLKASLDGAVNSSPFLADEHRAEIMSLIKTRYSEPRGTHELDNVQF
jgi:hypothetical protein